MTTAELIDLLTRDLRPVASRRPERDIGIGLGAGALGALALAAGLFGVRPQLGSLASVLPLAIKWAYALVVGGIALGAVRTLSRPGSAENSLRWLPAPALALASLAAWQLAAVPPANRAALILGTTSDRCPSLIALLALPVMAGVFTAIRRQAPVRLRRTGAAAGLLSGASTAAIYALSCPETSAAFVLVWYSLGMGVATAAGALAGPSLLRW